MAVYPIHSKDTHDALWRWAAYVNDLQARGFRVCQLHLTPEQWKAWRGFNALNRVAPGFVETFCDIPVAVKVRP